MPIIVDHCPCGAPLITTRERRDARIGLYCNAECFYTYRSRRPIGLTYTLRKTNPTSFKPGNEPWNKGKGDGK